MTSQRSPQKVNRGDDATESEQAQGASHDSKKQSFLLDLCEKVHTKQHHLKILSKQLKNNVKQNHS